MQLGSWRVRRRWVWPLRTGLMTVVALSGLQLFTVGCGSAGGAQMRAAAGAGGLGVAGGGATGVVGSSNAAGAFIGEGGTNSGGSSIVLDVTESPIDCARRGLADGLFDEQAFNRNWPPPRVLYSWTTPEQITELRNGGALFSRSQRPDLGRGNALEALAQLSSAPTVSGQLAAALNQQVFATARYAWINPWATRMGWPDEQYGNQLIRIELVDDAWTAHFDGVRLSVIDAKGSNVPLETALANPSRIGSMLFTPGASTEPAVNNTFGGNCGSGYREIVLGNLAMVKRWSIGTQEIGQRLEADVVTLTAFRAVLAECPAIEFDVNWSSNVVCSWEIYESSFAESYTNTLALPSDYYQPTVENIQRIIDTLTADAFVINPYAVEL